MPTAIVQPQSKREQALALKTPASHRKGPVAIIWHRFGPYHLARLKACATRYPVVGIEMSGADLTYAWRTETDPVPFTRETLFPGVDCTTVSARVVAGKVEAILDMYHPSTVAIPSWGTPYSLAALAWCLRTETPAVVMVDSNPEDKPRSMIAEWLKRRIVGKFGAGLACKTDYLSALGMPKSAISLGYNVVDNRYFAKGADALRASAPALRQARGLPRPFLLAVARFVPKKNLNTLLEAFATYCLGKPAELDLVLLGDGPLRSELELQVHRLGLDGRVHFPGFAQYDALPTWYAMANALILPSVVEQWGLVVNEAMAAGLPILISSRCGCADMLVENGRNGWHFNPLDPAEMAARINELATLPDQGVAFGMHSRELIADWSPATFAQSLSQAAEVAEHRRQSATIFDRILLHLLIPRVHSEE